MQIIATTDPGEFTWIARKPYITHGGILFTPGMQVELKCSACPRQRYIILAVGISSYQEEGLPAVVMKNIDGTVFWERARELVPIPQEGKGE